MAEGLHSELDIPEEIVSWVGALFGACNERLSEKVSNIPNAPEASSDLTFIEHLSHYASPVTFGSGWTVRIDTHYLGGLRHYRSWEIADIGVLLYYRRGGKLFRRKVGLLQSKRLYPSNFEVREEEYLDYQIGFARIATSDEVSVPISKPRRFSFDDDSRYGALKSHDEQYEAIKEYQEKSGIPVYYLLYNPWMLPYECVIPLVAHEQPQGDCEMGCRVVPAKAIFELLDLERKGYALKAASLRDSDYGYGWRLEHFMSDLLLRCKEGYIFETHSEERIQRLFFRRTGPISAAIAITIEAPV